MKKILSVTVLVAVIFSLSIVTLGTTNINGSQNADVYGTYQEGLSETIYSVDIEWSELSFTYTATQEWDPTTHSYKENVGVWNPVNAVIKITNHSNAEITAMPTWIADQGFESAIMTFDGAESGLTLNSAATEQQAVVGEIKVIPTGYLTETANGSKIGQITVTIIGQTDSDDGQNSNPETVVVTNESELQSALESGGNIKLGNNIEADYITSNNNSTIDLNQFTLTLSGEMSISNGNLNIINGCIDGYLNCSNGTVMLNQSVYFADQNNDEIRLGIAVNGGSVICEFNPEGYILLGTAADNGNGTWTITPNATN